MNPKIDENGIMNDQKLDFHSHQPLPFQPQHSNKMRLKLNWISRSFNRYSGIILFKLKKIFTFGGFWIF